LFLHVDRGESNALSATVGLYYVEAKGLREHGISNMSPIAALRFKRGAVSLFDVILRKQGDVFSIHIEHVVRGHSLEQDVASSEPFSFSEHVQGPVHPIRKHSSDRICWHQPENKLWIKAAIRQQENRWNALYSEYIAFKLEISWNEPNDPTVHEPVIIRDRASIKVD